jgi:hypothetical protein
MLFSSSNNNISGPNGHAVFDCSKTGNVGSNATQDTCLSVLSCVGRDLVMGQFDVQRIHQMSEKGLIVLSVNSEVEQARGTNQRTLKKK